MSLEKPGKTLFSYNAHALAFGARLTLPVSEVIPSQASVSLAPSGGEGYASVRNFNYKGIISFDEAHAYVSGSEEEMNGKRVFNTLATVTVRNLNVGNVVTADFITARLASRHDEDGDENVITLDGSFIRGLTVASERVTPELDTRLYADYPTYDAFNSGLTLPEEEFVPLAQRFAWEPSECKVPRRRRATLGGVTPTEGQETLDGPQLYAPKQKRPGVITASLLKNLREIEEYDGKKKQHVFRKGYVIHVPEFGKIYLGEVIIKRSQRRLNLLRFDLGCSMCGDASGGSAEGNGTPIGP